MAGGEPDPRACWKASAKAARSNSTFDTVHGRLTVILGMLFRRMLVMVSGVQVMALCHRGVMRRLFVMAGLVVLCSFVVVLGRLFMVVRSLFVVFVNCVIAHHASPGIIAY